jgi:2-dehydro-3-deoxyphosphogluconate aldolase/(4S)-4-hydroxy-2-oxoglutarate aldolase
VSDDIVTEIGGRRLLPVVVLRDAADAAPLADALLAGGLPVAEITFRTPAAEAALRALSARDDLLLGAGTVVHPDQAERAADAGAKFVVTPGLSARVVARCLDLGLTVIPGVATATELVAALDLGIDLVKFFPAETSGGLAAVKALSAPFPDVRFVPTGGIGPEHLESYLAHPSVLAVGGSWMVSPKLIAERNFAEVTRLTAAAVDTAKGAVHAR